MAANVVESVKRILAGFLAENGYELWNAEFVKTGRDYNLNIYIDAENGIGTDDCEKVSRFLEARLDEENLIDGQYYLIVSSPGMDRELLTDAHFKRYEGAPVDVALYRGYEGRKSWAGVLIRRTETELMLKAGDGDQCVALKKYEDGVFGIPLEYVSKVKLQVIF